VRNNNIVLPLLTLPTPQTNFLSPVSTVLASFSGQSLASNFPDLTLIDPNLKNGYAQVYFAGIQHRFSDPLTLEVNGQGSYGRRLITTDIINRDFSTLQGRYNPNLPDIAYRAGQGFSDYNALAAVLRYRTRLGTTQVAYTWSHTIDNQSEPLLGDFFNLNFTSIQAGAGSNGRAAFSQQFDPAADRGNSDFDQRQNLVIVSYWNLPGGWRGGILNAFRSGFPYTVTTASNEVPGGGIILNARPNLIGNALAPRAAVPGGQKLLNPAAFATPPPSTLGTLGRNSLIGPGFYNLDLSIGKSFRLAWLGEAGRVGVRADAFNILNHANLGNPDPLLTDPSFGIALYGRQGTPSSFPAVSPLNETPRQLQVSLRVEF
jgi:hypothetical protein